MQSQKEAFELNGPGKVIQENLDKEIVKGNTLSRFVDGALSGFFSGVVLQPL